MRVGIGIVWHDVKHWAVLRARLRALQPQNTQPALQARHLSSPPGESSPPKTCKSCNSHMNSRTQFHERQHTRMAIKPCTTRTQHLVPRGDPTVCSPICVSHAELGNGSCRLAEKTGPLERNAYDVMIVLRAQSPMRCDPALGPLPIAVKLYADKQDVLFAALRR